MNFQSILEELDRLYEEDAKKLVDEESTDKDSEENDEKEEITSDDKSLNESADEAEEVEDEEVEDEEIEIVDDEAVETQFVLECTKCGAFAIKVAEEASMVDLEETCQFCEESEGYKIIGTMLPYADGAEDGAEEEAVEEGLLNLDMPISANVNVKADGNNVPVLNTGI